MHQSSEECILDLIYSLIRIYVIDSYICGLDFDPLGILSVTLDVYGVCLISDLNTNEYSYHNEIKTESGNLTT